METHQGKGSRPGTQRPGQDALNREESVEAGDLVVTEMRRPIQRIATLLGLDDYADVIGRRHLEPVRSIMCRVAFRCVQDRCAGPRGVPWMSD
jgi:hypothetical protein